MQTKNHMEVVVAEIMQDKIFLDASGELAVNEDGSPIEPDVAQSDQGPSLDDLLA